MYIAVIIANKAAGTITAPISFLEFHFNNNIPKNSIAANIKQLPIE